VNDIVEELDMGCAPLRAVSCLENCFRAGVEGATKPLFVPAVKAYFNVRIDRPATFNFENNNAAKREVFASTRLTWMPDAGGLLPSFDGSLNIHMSESHKGRCIAIVRGTCTPTVGKNGKWLDVEFSKQIGRQTARQMLERLRKMCESVGG
jgi:hypothetical protein